MKTIRVIITCYPCFATGVTDGLRQSLVQFAGTDAILSELDKSSEQKYRGCEVVRGEYRYLIYSSSHCFVSTARNNGVNIWNDNKRKHQEIADCRGILFLDHDHTFEPEQIEQLVTSEKEVVAAAYPYRTTDEPLASCYVAGDFDDRMNGLLYNRIHNSATGMQKCGWVGGGFLYVASSVFGLIEYPWFRRGVVDNGEEALELGEDIGLCLQLAKAGIDVFCDCDNVVGHSK